MTTRATIVLASALCTIGCDAEVGELELGGPGAGFSAFTPGDPIEVELGVQGSHHVTLAIRVRAPEVSDQPAVLVVTMRHPNGHEFARSEYLRDTRSWDEGDDIVLDELRVHLATPELLVDKDAVVLATLDTGAAVYEGAAAVRGVTGR